MTYLLQIQTSDLGLQLLTEITASSISELQASAKNMVKNYRQVIGKQYSIWSITKNNGKFESKLLKKSIITGSTK